MTASQGPALTFHQSVSYDRLDMDNYSLDWSTRPTVQKTYPGRPRVELDRRYGFPPVSLPAVLEGQGVVAGNPRLDPERLSRVLFSAYGATAKSVHPGEEFFFRTAPSAGALYPVELYLLLGPDRAGECNLAPGLYHYPSPDHGLTLLRPGRFGTGETAFFLTAITFRSAWKYRARAWRYCCLDTGHATENLDLALGAEGFVPWPILVPGQAGGGRLFGGGPGPGDGPPGRGPGRPAKPGRAGPG